MTRFERLYGVTLSPRKTREVLVLLMSAEALLAFSYLGFIVVPPVSLTTMHILVIAAALILGTRASLAVCSVFILTAVWKATVTALQYNDLIFSPWRSGEPLLSLLLDLSRLVFAAATGLLFAWYFKKKRANDWPGIIGITLAGTFLHTASVYTAMTLCFPASGVKIDFIWTHLFSASNAVLYPLTVGVVAFLHQLLKLPSVKKFLTEVSRVDGEAAVKPRGIKRGLTMTAGLLALFVVAHLASRLDMAYSQLHSDTLLTLQTASHQIILQSFAALVAVGLLLAVALGWTGDYITAKTLTLHESRSEVERLKAKVDTNRRLQEKNDLLLQQQSVLKTALTRTKSASRAKAEFLASLSHEIRTPLNAVEGFTALAVKEMNPDSPARTNLLKARAAAEELLTRVTSFVAMMRVENDDITVNQTKFSLLSLMGDACNFVTPLAKAKGLQFDTAVPAKDVTVLGDRLQMTQILLNLLKNSLRYTPANGRISLTLEISEDDETDRVNTLFRLTDNGIGMNKTYFTRLYEPFDRMEKDVTDASNPRLELAVTKQMAELMGGTIDVVSNPGGHTEFIVRIPFMRAAASEAAPVEPTTVNCLSQSGRRVLVAEDNALNLDLMKAQLESLGFTVDTAPDGAQVLAMIEAKPRYDAVLLDIRMPRLGGCGAAREIRRRTDEKARTPLVAFSADTLDVWQKNAEAAGFDAVLEKPFTADDLTAALKAALKASPKEASSSKQC